MLKKIGIPLLGVVAALILLMPGNVQAGPRFGIGVTVGPPAYTYCDPYYGCGPYPYYSYAPAYPYGYYGYRNYPYGGYRYYGSYPRYRGRVYYEHRYRR